MISKQDTRLHKIDTLAKDIIRAQSVIEGCQHKIEQLRLDEEEDSKFKYDDPLKWPEGYYISSGEVWYTPPSYFKVPLIKSGNFYKTEIEAEQALLVQRAQTKVVKRIAELNEGWVPDWEDTGKDKYSTTFNHCEKKLEVLWWCRYQLSSSNMFLKNKRLCTKLISELPEELELILTQ